MDEEFYKQQRNSQAFKKFINYTETLKNDPVFVSELRWLRKHYVSFDTRKPIPENGLPFPKDKDEHNNNTMEYHYMVIEKGDNDLHYKDFQDKKYAFKKKKRIRYLW